MKFLEYSFDEMTLLLNQFPGLLAPVIALLSTSPRIHDEHIALAIQDSSGAQLGMLSRIFNALIPEAENQESVNRVFSEYPLFAFLLSGESFTTEELKKLSSDNSLVGDRLTRIIGQLNDPESIFARYDRGDLPQWLNELASRTYAALFDENGYIREDIFKSLNTYNDSNNRLAPLYEGQLSGDKSTEEQLWDLTSKDELFKKQVFGCFFGFVIFCVKIPIHKVLYDRFAADGYISKGGTLNPEHPLYRQYVRDEAKLTAADVNFADIPIDELALIDVLTQFSVSSKSSNRLDEFYLRAKSNVERIPEIRKLRALGIQELGSVIEKTRSDIQRISGELAVLEATALSLTSASERAAAVLEKKNILADLTKNLHQLCIAKEIIEKSFDQVENKGNSDTQRLSDDFGNMGYPISSNYLSGLFQSLLESQEFQTVYAPVIRELLGSSTKSDSVDEVFRQLKAENKLEVFLEKMRFFFFESKKEGDVEQYTPPLWLAAVFKHTGHDGANQVIKESSINVRQGILTLCFREFCKQVVRAHKPSNDASKGERKKYRLSPLCLLETRLYDQERPNLLSIKKTEITETTLRVQKARALQRSDAFKLTAARCDKLIKDLEKQAADASEKAAEKPEGSSERIVLESQHSCLNSKIDALKISQAELLKAQCEFELIRDSKNSSSEQIYLEALQSANKAARQQLNQCVEDVFSVYSKLMPELKGTEKDAAKQSTWVQSVEDLFKSFFSSVAVIPFVKRFDFRRDVYKTKDSADLAFHSMRKFGGKLQQDLKGEDKTSFLSSVFSRGSR